MTTIFAALWLADNVGSFFEGGGAAFYHSPIQPQGMQKTCLGWASWSNFVSDENYDIKGYTSPYFAAHMINLEWVQHRSGVHQHVSVLRRHQGRRRQCAGDVLRGASSGWKLVADAGESGREQSAHRARGVSTMRDKEESFSGPVTLVTFGSEQYVWINDGPNSHADPDNPPVATTSGSESADHLYASARFRERAKR